jgi:signal transduction histidine kinase
MKTKHILFITLGVACVVVAAGALIGTTVKHRLQTNLVNNYSQEETVIGNQVASTLQSKVQNVENNLEILALEPNVESSNPTLCNSALNYAYDNTDIGVGNVGRVNTQGTFYCSINKKLIGVPASKLGPYVGQLINDPKHQPVLSNILTVPGVAGYAVAIHVPVYNLDHQFIGTLGGAFYFNQLATSYLNNIKFAQTGYASLQDDNGDILYSHKAGRVGKNFFSSAIQANNTGLKNLDTAVYAARKGKISVVRYTNNLGIHKIASVVPVSIVPNHRWIIIVNVPLSEISSTYVNSGFNSAFNALGLILIFAVLIIVVLTITVMYRDARLKKTEDQFISLVSHQLRTPLTSIRLFSEMLSGGEVGKLNEKQADYMSNIHVSTLRMIRLVGDILNVSRLELNRLKVDSLPTEISSLIQSCIDEVKPLAAGTGIKIVLNEIKPDASNIKIDQNLFAQVLHNLLTNAIRYSNSDGGKIDVSFMKKGKAYVLKVADNGIGIPKEAQGSIFKRFYRAENAKLAVGEGTGLGLNLVKLILEQSGCSINFDSEIYKGTTFYVTIPQSGMVSKSGDKTLERH